MAIATRREFLGETGSGLLALGLGPTLFGELASALVLPRGGGELDFGELEPLVALMQETDPDALLPLLVRGLHKGTQLRTLIAAGALANARTHGGEDYNGYHAFMALVPSYEMAQRLPQAERPLPVLKVLHRNTGFIRDSGGRSSERLARIDVPVEAPVEASNGDATGLAVRACMREREMEGAERTFADLAREDPATAYDELQPVLHDDVDVHRIVLAWRAWDMLRLVGEEHAHTMLRQSVRHCVDRERSRVRKGSPEPSIRRLLPACMERLANAPAGTREVDDETLDELGDAIFHASRDEGACIMADALVKGYRRDALGEALSLAGNKLLLHDPGRSRGERGKPEGSIHGASVGVHASDAARAWRNVTAVVSERNQQAGLIVGAYHTAGQSHRVGTSQFPWREEHDAVENGDAGALLRQLSEAVRQSDQYLAVAVTDRCCETDVPTERVLAVLLRFGIEADGALHAEKYFSTVVEDVRDSRPAFCRRHLLGLARVTASEYGYEAGGYEQARELLGV